MKKTGNRAIAMLLACLQIVLLFAFAVPQAKAVETSAAQSTELPVLNKTIRGTVQFGTFNFISGDPENGKEGADYVMPFTYSDDLFAKPSYDASASKAKIQNWTALTDKSLAMTSLNFAMASFGSNESVLAADFSRYDKNGIQFLKDCEFDFAESNCFQYNASSSDPLEKENSFNEFPTKDSIGVVFGSKKIKVWNNEEQKNETYTLVAVGVRGAGYGAEWASNFTLGASGVHDGFRTAANKVERALNAFMNDPAHPVSGKVKYWLVGYSRAGAVANLVAGDITKAAASYGTSMEDIYCYTNEAAAGAVLSASGNEPVDSGAETIYPNIHNTINKLDLVPRLSPEDFGNNRLGIDYLLPYHVNANENLNDAYYKRMYEILETVALGYSGQADPMIADAAPATFPYNRKVDVYDLSLVQLGLDVLGSNAANLGLQKFEDDTDGDHPIVQEQDGHYQIFIDDFLDQFVKRFAETTAWDYNAAPETSNAMVHRQKFVSQGYQDDFREVIGAALGVPGLSLNAMVEKIKGTMGLGMATLADEVTSMTKDINALDEGKTTRRTSIFHGFKEVNCMTDGGENLAVILNYVLEKANMFDSSTLSKVKTAVNNVSPILFGLFAKDHANYSAQYTGTLLKYGMNTIFVTHMPEISASWQMAMDENYTSDYRKITLPQNTDIKMYEFRGAYFNNENLDFDANASVVAEFKNGEMVSSLDGRIDWETGSDTITIWYPGNLDIRFDVKALAPVTVRSANANLSDYEPAVDSNNIQGANLKVVDYTSSRKPNGNVPDTVSLTRNLKAQANNVPTAVNVNDFLISSSIPLQTGEMLQILAEGGSNSLDGSSDAVYTIRKSAIKIADFGTSQTVATNVLEKGTVTGAGGSFAVNGSNELTFTPSVSGTDYSAFSTLTSSTYRFVNDRKSITAHSKVDVIPATNIYYDDPTAGTLTDPTKTTTLVSTIVDGKVDQTTTRDIKFYGTGIDAYCICDSSAGYVKAELLDAQGNAIDGVRPMVMNNYYTGTLYNVPTIHFDVPGKTADTYILRLSASFGKSYKLDGVRVFNESHEDPVEAKLAQVDEGEATYVNVRDILLGKDAASALKDLAYTEGAVYFTGDAERQSPADYETIGPKRELYLTQSGQGIAFNISNPDEVNIAIGLRAADNNAAGVKINGQPKDVTSFDTYYSVTPIDGNVSIEHDSGMVAVTYIKITAKTEVVESGSMLTEAVGPQRIRANAKLLSFVNAPISDPEESPAVEPSETPDPTPAIPELIKQLLSRFVSQLFDSISRLFGGW